MLLPRVLTALVLLPLFLSALFGLPQFWWGAAMLGVVAIACSEWAKLIGLSGGAGFVGLLAMVAAVCAGAALAGGGTALLAIALVFWMAVAPVWLRGWGASNRTVLAGAGVVVLGSAWFALYELQQEAPRLLALMGVVWIADTGAYFAGRRFGRRKLAPTISPGKTWEGVAGGFVGVGVYHAALWWVWAPPSLADTRLLDLAIVAGMTVLSIEGDLFESWLKRRAGVKDSGKILPGHGGVLDRIDGVIAAVPFAALLSRVA